MINCRKICQYCKCFREDYNIIEDDVRIGCNVYLGEVNYFGFLSDDDSGCVLDEYVWVLLGLNFEQVSGVNFERLFYLYVLFLIRRILLFGIFVRIFVINVVFML